MSNETERYGLHVWRYNAQCAGEFLGEQSVVTEDEFNRAADEIERLRRENAELKDRVHDLDKEARTCSDALRNHVDNLPNIRAEAVEEAARHFHNNAGSKKFESYNPFAERLIKKFEEGLFNYAQSLREQGS